MQAKWLIPSDPEATEKPWEEEYQQHGYSKVWSITLDVSAREALLQFVPRTVRQVLIPGCGSETALQQHLIAAFPQVEAVWCTDWSQNALDRAAYSFSHPKVRYQQEDTARLSFSEGSFDVVLIVNSILGAEDALNRAMVQECYRTLRESGRLVGFFPTIFCALEHSYLYPGVQFFRTGGFLSVEDNAFYDKERRTRQLYYSPLRLARICKEAGFTRERFELFFFDSEYARRQTEKIYGIPPDSDLFIWEILAVLKK
jgi:SAM-dependent methyltransferase